MSAKPSLWQALWQIDPGEELGDALATHDSGLRVRLVDGKGVADNAEAIALALVPEHGAHNSTAMVQRLVREGATLLVDPHARGWRG